MKTKDQIKQEFMQDLKALLEKYDARMMSTERFIDCPCIEVSIPAVWDETGNIISPSVDIDLGPYIDKSDFKHFVTLSNHENFFLLRKSQTI